MNNLQKLVIIRQNQNTHEEIEEKTSTIMELMISLNKRISDSIKKRMTLKLMGSSSPLQKKLTGSRDASPTQTSPLQTSPLSSILSLTKKRNTISESSQGLVEVDSPAKEKAQDQ